MATELEQVRALSLVPMKSEQETKRVEIIMLKFKEAPAVIDDAISRIINNTQYPFKLTIYDNRLNTANTSKIWNKLVSESTCDYVCIIDSDAFIQATEPCWLTRLMESVEETGIVVPVGMESGGINKALQAASYGSTRRSNGAWSGFCFLFKKTIWDQFKFDEQFYIYGQDSEWAIRTMKQGHPAVIREDVWVRHLGSYSFKDDPLREADKDIARYLYQKKTK